MIYNSSINRSILMLIATLCFGLSGCTGSDSKPVKTNRQAEEGIYAADISSDASMSVVSSAQEGIVVWSLEYQQQIFKWHHEGDEDSVNTIGNIHIAADNSYVVTSDREAFALWNLSSGDPEGFWRIDESTIRDIAVSNQGRGILVGRGSGKVMFFEPQTGRRIEFLGHQEKINSVDISPNGHYALTGGNDYVAFLWDTRSGQVVHRFTHSSRVTKVALDDQGRYGFTADSQRGAKIWDLQTGLEVSQLDFLQRQKIFSTAKFSSDGKYLLTGSPGRRLNLWEVESGDERHEWRVTPKEGTRPQSAVVYATGFTAENQVISISSSGLAEYWAIDY